MNKSLVTNSGREYIEPSASSELHLIEDDELVTLLRDAPNEMLEPLVEFIREKGRPTSKLGQTTIYKRYAPDHKMYANEIAAEIQRYGANDVARLARRGEGVRYSVIVRDVAKKLGVGQRSRSTERLEAEIISKLFCDASDKMTPDQRVEILRTMKIRNLTGVGVPLGAAAFQTAVSAGGFSSYIATVIVANAMSQSVLGHGLSFGANWMLVKGVSIAAGPPGVAFAAAVAVNILAGPAYRVTIPCVVQVALIRQHVRRQRRRKQVRFIGFLIAGALALLAYLLVSKK